MGVRIGRYTERENATHLPKFGCRILEDSPPYRMVVLEGDIVAAVRQEIRDYKKSLK
ncbi:MAG: hypothetical protein OXD43_05320 [Bacteroidetes bacterium]|nr:hypothetical protein [Bacteroidota bacterium]